MNDLRVNGIPNIETKDGTASAVQTELAPPEGEMWDVFDGYFYHDDNGAARDCTLYLIDTDNSKTYLIATFAGLANDTYKYLRADCAVKERLILTNGFYLRWTVSGIGAGKKGYIRLATYQARHIPLDNTIA